MNIPRPLALITGASSGIGSAFARRLASDGFDLILVARRKDRLEGLARTVETAHGIRAEVLPADLTDPADLRRVEERIAASDLDLLVNNAGFGTVGRFFETEVDSQERMNRLHVLATMRLTHAALAGMVPRNKGAIVNVSSLAAFFRILSNASYCATKAWINAFTEVLHLELKTVGSAVKMQALCPGFTFSEFHDTMGMDRKKIPATMWMSAEYVVNASLKGLRRGKLFVVPDWRYRLFASLQPLLPRILRHAMAVKGRRRLRREQRAMAAGAH